jgi:hypothetical protein
VRRDFSDLALKNGDNKFVAAFQFLQADQAVL